MMHSGLDPELLALADGVIVPAAYFLPAPHRDADGNLNNLSWDNAAAEMRPTHSKSTKNLILNARLLYKKANRALDDAIRDGNPHVPFRTKFSLTPASVLTKEDLAIPSVQTFGCSPSNLLADDYSEQITVPYRQPDETPIRSAGFHIHQEMTDPTAIQPAVAILDGFLGLVDVLANDKLGYLVESRMRREDLGYGRAGEYRSRVVASGATVLEYRTMSPWPMMGPKAMTWGVNVMRTVCAMDYDALMVLLGCFPRRTSITQAINSANPQSAAILLGMCYDAWRLKGNENAIRWK